MNLLLEKDDLESHLFKLSSNFHSLLLQIFKFYIENFQKRKSLKFDPSIAKINKYFLSKIKYMYIYISVTKITKLDNSLLAWKKNLYSRDTIRHGEVEERVSSTIPSSCERAIFYWPWKKKKNW